MAKVILFDYWGTLVENGVWSPIKQVKRIFNIHLPFPEYVLKMENAMMTQKFISLREAFGAIAKEFNIHPDEEQYQELIGMWNKSWMLSTLYPETIEVLENLKDVKLVLISNSDSVSIINSLEKHGLRTYFDNIFFSFEMGVIKSDPDFLKRVLDTCGVKPVDCILVGDSIHSDMVAAEKIGIPSLLVDRRGTRTYPHKISSLREIKYD